MILYKPVYHNLPIMFKEIIGVVTVLVTLHYVTYQTQKLIEQNAEFEERVLLITVKVDQLRALNNDLQEQNQVFRYEAAAAQRTLSMHNNENPRRYFTRAEWEVGSEAWQALSEDEKEVVLNVGGL